MGEDIHAKTLIYSKIEKKYIDGLSLTTCPEYSSLDQSMKGETMISFQFLAVKDLTIRSLVKLVMEFQTSCQRLTKLT